MELVEACDRDYNNIHMAEWHGQRDATAAQNAPASQPPGTVARRGELMQIDASIHAWLEDRGQQLARIAFITLAILKRLRWHDSSFSQPFVHPYINPEYITGLATM